MEKTIDYYIEQRNHIQLFAENHGKKLADKCWVELSVANRHIQRVLSGTLRLEIVENEINQCFRRVRKMLDIPAEG